MLVALGKDDGKEVGAGGWGGCWEGIVEKAGGGGECEEKE